MRKIIQEGASSPGLIADAGRLNLYHLGAEVGQQLGAIWPTYEITELEDSQMV
jgi:hypothetical protein